MLVTFWQHEPYLIDQVVHVDLRHIDVLSLDGERQVQHLRVYPEVASLLPLIDAVLDETLHIVEDGMASAPQWLIQSLSCFLELLHKLALLLSITYLALQLLDLCIDIRLAELK